MIVECPTKRDVQQAQPHKDFPNMNGAPNEANKQYACLEIGQAFKDTNRCFLPIDPKCSTCFMLIFNFNLFHFKPK